MVLEFESLDKSQRLGRSPSKRYLLQSSGTARKAAGMWEQSPSLLALVALIINIRGSIRSQGTLPQPKISLDQKTGVYCKGDAVTIHCWAGKDGGGRSYELYREDHPLPRLVAAMEGDGRAAFAVNASRRLVNYHCRYVRGEGGARLVSPPSRSVRVFVTGRNVKPVLGQEKQKVQAFARGESLRLVCRARTTSMQPYFQLLRGNGSLAVAPQRAEYASHSATFEIGEVAQVGSENYTCAYWRMVSGRQIHSQRSDPLAVTVIERPPPPHIGPAGNYRTFIRGETVEVRCTAPVAPGNSTFLLYQEGTREAVARRRVEAGAQSATFNVTGLRYKFAAVHYACGYTAWMWERDVESVRSKSVSIVVEGPLVRPFLYLDGVPRLYEVGEPVKVVCQGALRDRSSTFYLYHGNGERPVSWASPQGFTFSVTINIKDTMRNGTQSYTCGYRRRFTDRTVDSIRSNVLTIKARDPLSKPELILNVRSGIYWKGEHMTMTCKGDITGSEGHYYFSRDGYKAHTGEPSSFQTVRILGEDRAGLYQCQYALPTPGKWFQSPFSNGVRVKEIGDLPKPSLELGGEDFVAGQPANLSCQAPAGETGGRFYRYQGLDRVPVLSTKAQRRSRTVTFHLRTVTGNGTESYRCAYRRRQGGDEIYSQRSDPIFIDTCESPLVNVIPSGL